MQFQSFVSRDCDENAATEENSLFGCRTITRDLWPQMQPFPLNTEVRNMLELCSVVLMVYLNQGIQFLLKLE